MTICPQNDYYKFLSNDIFEKERKQFVDKTKKITKKHKKEIKN